MRRIRTFTSSSSNATITPQKGMTILKNVSIKSHLSILRVPRGKNAQYQYVKDLPTLHKGIRQGLYVFFGPLVSEAVCHFAKCSSWLRFTHHLGDYGIIPCQVVAGTGGFEPPTFRLTVWRSNQLKLCPQQKRYSPEVESTYHPSYWKPLLMRMSEIKSPTQILLLYWQRCFMFTKNDCLVPLARTVM